MIEPGTLMPETHRDLVVRDVSGLTEMKACESLYAEVMGLRREDGSINPRLLIALQHNGGYVVGAFLGARLLGFAYSFLGCDPRGEPRDPYQYSQLTVVAADAQGRGVGRLLKYAQRDRARSSGVHLIRWAYHPLRARNAHFNLDVLGGRVSRIVPAMYGEQDFGTGPEQGTDRFIVDWDVTETANPPRHYPTPANQVWRFSEPITDGADVLVATPASWEAYRAQSTPADAEHLRSDLLHAFTAALQSGRAAVSCQLVDDAVAVYRFSPCHGDAS